MWGLGRWLIEMVDFRRCERSEAIHSFASYLRTGLLRFTRNDASNQLASPQIHILASVLLFSTSLLANEAFLEAPIVFATKYTPAFSTELKPGVGVGWTHFVWKYDALRLGYGALFSISPQFWQGTKEVYTVGFENDLETRAYLAYAFDGSNISFWPYAFIAPNVTLRLTKISVYASKETTLNADLGIRSGLGLQVRFREMAIKIDTSAGYTLSGINLRTWIMVGFGIF